MTEFIISYDPAQQIGIVYGLDPEIEIIVALVDGVEWLPVSSFIKGDKRDLPPCFNLDHNLIDGLDRVKASGRPETVEIQ